MKKIVKLLSLSAVIMLMLSLTGCYYDELQVAPLPPVEQDVSFATDIQPIFDAKDCMQCHNASRNPDLREGLAYASLVPAYAAPNDSEGSQLLTKLMDGHRSVADFDIALIKAWIDQGAKNN
jgi:cytochrome c551/c552